MKFVVNNFVILPRKTKKDKKYNLNLNIYRNTCFSVLNQAKRIFSDNLADELIGVKFTPPIKITFQYFKPTKRRSDKANVLSVVEKFFCDALVKYECIPDDNDDYIFSQIYLPTIYDKNNGRVEIEIEEIECKEQLMMK